VTASPSRDGTFECGANLARIIVALWIEVAFGNQGFADSHVVDLDGLKLLARTYALTPTTLALAGKLSFALGRRHVQRFSIKIKANLRVETKGLLLRQA
jgi:hypothetical protein